MKKFESEHNKLDVVNFSSPGIYVTSYCRRSVRANCIYRLFCIEHFSTKLQ